MWKRSSSRRQRQIRGGSTAFRGLTAAGVVFIICLLAASASDAREVLDPTDPAFAGGLIQALPPPGLGRTETSFQFTSNGVTFRFESLSDEPLSPDGSGILSFAFGWSGVHLTVDPPVSAIGFRGTGSDSCPRGTFLGTEANEPVSLAPWCPPDSFFGAADVGEIGRVDLSSGASDWLATEMIFVPSGVPPVRKVDLTSGKLVDVPVAPGDLPIDLLSSEVPGQADVVGRRYLFHPDVTLKSYAAVRYATRPNFICSGIMIGPNLVMSAAHCGHGDGRAQFRTYRGLSTTSDSETVDCWMVYQTLPSGTDIMLGRCDDINGLPPGIKYGYVDLDASPPVQGQSIYSVWWNPLQSPPLPNAMFYSPGEITALGAPVSADAWATGGASGSAHLDPKSHRVTVGPLSTSAFAQIPAGGPNRNAFSMRTYLRSATVNAANTTPTWNGSENYPLELNDVDLQIAGLTNLSSFGGLLDKDQDNIFDIQEALEQIVGEARRDHYSLTFESERQDALWSPGPAATVRFDTLNHFVNLDVPAGGGLALEHSRLNLKPNTRYRLNVMTHTNSATTQQDLTIGLYDDLGGTRHVKSLSTVPGTGWQMQTFALRTGGVDPVPILRIEAGDPVNVSLAALSIIEADAPPTVSSIMDFDTHDKRHHWRNDNNGARAYILPDGNGAGPNWAALLFRTGGLTAPAPGQDWPLRNRQMALLAQKSHRICFNWREYGNPARLPITGYVRVKSDNVVVMVETFDVNKNVWTSHCTDEFQTIGSDNNLQFGIYSPPPDQPPGWTAYLVDDIEIIEL